MGATKRGVFHNLKESEYTVSNDEAVFFFSSEFLLNKFLDSYKENRETFDRRFNKWLSDTSLNMNTFADLVLYKQVEKRGFRAWIKGVDVSWHDLEKYALRKMTEPSSPDWSRIQKPKLAERLKIME